MVGIPGQRKSLVNDLLFIKLEPAMVGLVHSFPIGYGI